MENIVIWNFGICAQWNCWRIIFIVYLKSWKVSLEKFENQSSSKQKCERVLWIHSQYSQYKSMSFTYFQTFTFKNLLLVSKPSKEIYHPTSFFAQFFCGDYLKCSPIFAVALIKKWNARNCRAFFKEKTSQASCHSELKMGVMCWCEVGECE